MGFVLGKMDFRISCAMVEKKMLLSWNCMDAGWTRENIFNN